ncbi:MAG: hypothetical protein N3D74_04820 [Caldisericia bacterium]|nr:hypothetical protein [Caldisericia bacterium]
MAKKEISPNKTKKVAPKKSEEQRKRENLLLVLFIILMIIAGALFYFLYLKPPSTPPPTQTQTGALQQVLKNLNIDPIKDEIEKRSLSIPSLETKTEEIGKENPFKP